MKWVSGLVLIADHFSDGDLGDTGGASAYLGSLLSWRIALNRTARRAAERKMEAAESLLEARARAIVEGRKMTQAMTEFVLQAVSAATAIASGGFWIRSALIQIQWPAMATLDGPAPVVMRALNRQSTANARAAWLAAIAAIAQGLAIGVHEWAWPIPSLSISAAWAAEAPALPNPALTPGAVDSAVTLDIICNRTTRERRHVSTATKRAVLAGYGVPADRSAYYEIDHLIPLALGGANVVANLWPQPWPEADEKDALETEMQRRACVAYRTLVPVDAAAALAQEQREIATDWRAAYERYVGRR